jgi:hypothetical protein
MKSFQLVFIIGIIIFSISLCEKEPGQSHNKKPFDNLPYELDPSSLDRLDGMTLASLEKINDYPLYSMTYYGDYGFGEYIEMNDRVLGVHIWKDKESWGCTCFAALEMTKKQGLGENLTGRITAFPCFFFASS